MLASSDLLFFGLAAFGLVISPGPNMIYLISRTLVQGRKAGLISLAGVICGFLFHIIMVSLGLTIVLLKVPYAYAALKSLGVAYLLYLAFQAIKPNGKNIFEKREDLKHDSPLKLFSIGLFTNVLNPKVAVFYLSFFPQFIKPEQGDVLIQSLQLGVTQMTISFTVNFIIVLTAARAAAWFSRQPAWMKVQKWFMASVLTFLAVRMAFEKSK
ncbi:MAG: LysE family translocator [Bacteroidetes bacterium]|nr:LysE family translocator [Bacteroidota bacterium]